MNRQPVLFVSHGAPDVLLNPGPTVAAWAQLGAGLPRPQAILAISAHWATREPTVSTAATPDTIHDFGGFPPALYAMNYKGTLDIRITRSGEFIIATIYDVWIRRHRILSKMIQNR